MKNKYKRKIKNFLKIVFILSILIIISIYIYNTYINIEVYDSNYEVERTQSTLTGKTVEEVEENSTKISTMLQNTTKSVVGIAKLKNSESSIFSNRMESDLGLGTGVIVSEDGYILSNEHVTGEKYSTCYITLENGQNFDGTVMWSDVDLDLSITKINAKNLNYVLLGDSNKIKLGETVYAIGNPVGFEFRRTVTSGIISGVNRSIKLEEQNNLSYMSNLIQTDATINPGNSGGPLIYPDGQVIGINTVKISSAEGIGFAIPINVVKGVIDCFKTEGRFEQATLGIYAYDKDVIPYLDSNIKFEKGIYIAQITEGSPASKVDLKEGDIITSIDGIEINKMNELREYIYTKKPRDEISLKIIRKKINREIKVVLGKK